MLDLKVQTHSGETVYVKVDNYDSKAMAQDLNDININVIELGGEIFSRIDIIRVSQQKEEII